LIFDIQFDETCSEPEKEHDALLRIPGVIDTGFFFNLAGRVIIGFRWTNCDPTLT
jgi:ribose 5-phosphate isomerase A